MDEPEETELEAAIAQIEQWSHGGQDEKVIPACTDLLNRFPEAFALYYFRAQARAARGDREGAIEDLGHAMTRNPKEPALFYFRGLWRLDAESIQMLRAIFRKRSSSRRGWNRLTTWSPRGWLGRLH
jgi:hypothetical protein